MNYYTPQGLLLILFSFALPGFAQTDTTHTLPQVTVRDARFEQTGFSTWRADTLPVGGIMNLSERLAWSNALAILSNAPGTLSTASVRGMGASHTPVFWNGLNLQSPMHGVTDLALLPVWPLDRIEVRYGGQSAVQSSGAMGGSIMVDPQWIGRSGFSGSIGASAGSFGRAEGIGALGFSEKKTSTSARASWQSADNDFPFRNTSQAGHPLDKQQNNAGKRWDIQQFNRFIIKEKHVLKTALWTQQAFREIPPPMTAAVRESWQKDRSTRAVASWEYARDERHFWQTRAAWLDESIQFRLAGHTDTSRSHTAILGTDYTAMIGRHLTLKSGGTFIRQWAQADGYADSTRWFRQTRLAGYTLAEWTFPHGRLSALLRQEWAERQSAPFTGSFGGQFAVGEHNTCRFHISRNFNLPTFNDRYWQALGKPDLQPEKGYSADLGWIFTAKRFSAEIAAFHILIDDWILWLPGSDGIFRPGNLRKVWSRGLESSLRYSLKAGKWNMYATARYQYTRTTTLAAYAGDQSALHRQLRYVPKHAGGLSLLGARGSFSGVYLHQFTGLRYTTSDNARSLKGFGTGNLLLQYKFSRLRKTGLTLDARLENCWNARYQYYEFQAMPGCSWRVGGTFAF